MRSFNCTVKDIAFRSEALDVLTSSMAANGYTEARADYLTIKNHWNDALNCAANKTGSEKSRIALRYLSGGITIDRISSSTTAEPSDVISVSSVSVSEDTILKDLRYRLPSIAEEVPL